MRRKVIRDFANVFCQKFIPLPSGYDLASFVHYGSGNYYLDILNGVSSYNETGIPNLKTREEHKVWLIAQSNNHRINFADFEHAHLKIIVAVSDVDIRESYGHIFATADFKFICESEIRTDEKSHSSKMFHEQEWGFCWFYEKLYGSLADLMKQKSKI